MDRVPDLSAYCLSHWILFHERWLQNLSEPDRTTSYAPGKIFMVDLGATNFGHEPMFDHPCVVPINDDKSIMVVPCLATLRKGYQSVIQATTTDGTVLQMNAYRWIAVIYLG